MTVENLYFNLIVFAVAGVFIPRYAYGALLVGLLWDWFNR